MQEQITAAIQKHGRPLSPGALAKALGTGTGPLRKHVAEMIDAGNLKATGKRRGRRIGLPGMDFGGAAAGALACPAWTSAAPRRPPSRAKSTRRRSTPSATRARRSTAPCARATAPAPAERFIPTVDAERRLVIVNGGEPLIFDDAQTAAIASLLFNHYDKA